MRYSVIDMGSNSVRHLKAIVKNNKIDGEKSLIVTRLGEGVDETNRLTERAIRETIDAVKVFQEDAIRTGTEEIYIMATSAVRDAENRVLLLEGVKRATGLEIEVLSGEREAIVGCLGVQKGLEKEEAILIIDIGGGSTEFIVYDGFIRHASSANVGAVRMTGKHVGTDPITLDEKEKMKEDIKTIIAPHIEAISKYQFDEIIGIGGTATTFGAIDLEMENYDRHKIHNHVVLIDAVKQMNQIFQTCDLSMRKEIAGLAPKRADVITAGGLILQEIMMSLNYSELRVSDFDNLEGYLVEKLDL